MTNQNQLCLHTGSTLTSLEHIHSLPTPAALGPRHRPYPFGTYIDQIKEMIAPYGLVVEDESYALSPDEMKFFGLLKLRASNSTYAPMVGLRGSHDMSLSRGVAIGSKVFVCDNLAFRAERVLATKQTTNIERRLPYLIDRVAGSLPHLVHEQDVHFERLMETQLIPHQADSLLTEIIRRNIVPASKARIMIREWDTPSHEEHTQHGRSLWRMYNAVTEVIKPDDTTSMNGYDTLRARTLKLGNLMDEVLETVH